MIRTNPNPPMSKRDVARFAVVMRRALTNSYTPRQRQRIEAMKTEMKLISAIIRKNHGGKDPLLGY